MRKEASKSSNSETLRHRVLPAVAEASSAHDHAVILFGGTCAFCGLYPSFPNGVST